MDTVGVCEQDKTDARPMEKKPSVAFDKLLKAAAMGNTEEDDPIRRTDIVYHTGQPLGERLYLEFQREVT